jgi:hypothetical protein
MVRNIDRLAPQLRRKSLDRLRAVADGRHPHGAGAAVVSLEVTGGAPGERYHYRIAVSGDGTAERLSLDELSGRGSEDAATSAVDPALASRVFAAARDVGLLEDARPEVPGEPAGEVVPDSMVAVITVREGDVVRRVAVPAADPRDAAAALPGVSADVPLDTEMQVPAETASALQPLLDALTDVERAL